MRNFRQGGFASDAPSRSNARATWIRVVSRPGSSGEHQAAIATLECRLLMSALANRIGSRTLRGRYEPAAVSGTPGATTPSARADDQNAWAEATFPLAPLRRWVQRAGLRTPMGERATKASG